MASQKSIRHASAEMAHYLVSLLTRGTFDPSILVPAGEQIAGWSNSASEHAEYLLCWKLDLALPKSDGPRALAKSTEPFSAHFASGRFDHHFSDIFECYIDFADWRGDLPTTRGLFVAPKDHDGILKSLAALEYLEVSDGRYCWTDKAGPAMRSACVWNTDLQSNADIKELDQEKRAREIACGLSNDLIILARANPEAAFWPLMKSLRAAQWYHEQPDKLLIERVIEIVHSQAQHISTPLN